ncbi:probably inactive leucine-rich repeat receptor-like protein kinase IMK2 [Durio zibethinus]|uniref:Probably inactive leucine-rich repeat receptor-like protein kinase IMK2 n=1 Tax=Durio zibethinus TaxID=66656 RepID=A0A6P5X1C0_DURZI|nr:probably inactive leucine-rich repeat receptor-like protein kinase IMK2 [Durio zibethinus]
MSQNAFKRNIPLCLGGMMYLAKLDVSHNQFFGGIPKELGMSRSLELLKLSNNNLNGKMFPAIYLDGNNVDGEISHFSSISSSVLQTLDLSDNQLSGKLPIWLWNYTSLRLLALANNQFEGPVPIELCNLVNLGFLDLSQNRLSGTIPSCSNLQNIKHVHLNSNKLSGPLSPAFYRSSSLVTLDLSENNFTGKIPDRIDTLPALSVLLLKANQFHDEFPMHLCKLNSLSIVDLSQNKLSGPIPSCLSNLTLEQWFEKSDVNNDFSVISFDTILAIASTRMKIYDLLTNKDVYPADGASPRQERTIWDIRREQLRGKPSSCGPPLKNSCGEGDSLETSSASSAEDEVHSFIDMGDFYISFGVSYAIILLATGIVALLQKKHIALCIFHGSGALQVQVQNVSSSSFFCPDSFWFRQFVRWECVISISYVSNVFEFGKLTLGKITV